MISLLLITLALSTPLILAAMGGYTSERAGVINIGLEGMMLIACVAVALVSPAHGAVAGLCAGIGAATLLSLLHWLATQKYGIDHVVSGMAVNALAYGGSNFLFDTLRERSTTTGMPHLNEWFFVSVAVILPLLLWLYSGATRGGLRLVAVGADPVKARLAGIDPVRVRFAGLVATGVFTGLAGAMLVSDVESFTDNMTAGRGFIALAALIVGGWRPIPAAIACLVFGFVSSLRLLFQGTETLNWAPSQLWASLPYIVTMIVLAGFLGRSRTPAGLGKL